MVKKKETQGATPGKNKKPLLKRWWFWLIVIILVIAGLSSLGGNNTKDSATAKSEKVSSSSEDDDYDYDYEEDEEESDTSDEADSADDSENATVEVPTGYFGNSDVEDITVSGSGNNVSNKFTLKAGFAIITQKNTGSSNFIVDMKNGDGTDFKSLANEIGTFTGTTYIDVPTDGEYLFNVQSDGNWSFSISQRVAETSVNNTLQASGSGQQVVFMGIPEDGSYKLTATNTGDSNFIVSNGESKTLINEIGNYSGSQVQSIDEGTYAISVISNGNWTLKFEKM